MRKVPSNTEKQERLKYKKHTFEKLEDQMIFIQRSFWSQVES